MDPRLSLALATGLRGEKRARNGGFERCPIQSISTVLLSLLTDSTYYEKGTRIQVPASSERSKFRINHFSVRQEQDPGPRRV